MASSVNSPSTAPLLALPNSSSMFQASFLPKTSQRSVFRKKKPFTFVSKTLVTCKASNEKQNNSNAHFDRRGVLLGLGGLYGATNLVTDPFALADPIKPDIFDCGESFVDESKDCINVPCCPPKPERIFEFQLPKVDKIRYRQATHSVDCNYLQKFELAMERMKALPDDDPRSFMQQANIHCAYCNGAYSQEGDPKQKIEIHYSWLFFPFHRLYLYFYEKILGKLIDDPDFTIPFWNWDSPCGMTIPPIYIDPNSPLHDVNRNPNHQPPNLVNLNDGESFGPKKEDGFDELSKASQIQSNLHVMYREMVRNSKSASCFHGAEYHAGCRPNNEPYCTPEPRGGTIENGVHVSVHKFVGNPANTFNEDMGNFYSAAKDPLFYAHHANVDRMWNIWKGLPGRKRRDFSDRDWLDASFLFYDENANMVRVKVWQALDSTKLGYDYDPNVDIPWLKSKPTPRKRRQGQGQGQDQAIVAQTNNTTGIRFNFPIVLDKTVRIKVRRPKKPMTKLGEEDKEEALILQNIQLNSNDSVHFDVSISDEDNEKPCKPGDSEYIGDFKHIPHGTCKPMELKTNKYLLIADVLEDLDMQDEDSIVVTLDPTEGVGLVTISNIKIDYIC